MPLRISALLLAPALLACAPLHAQEGRSSPAGWVDERPVPVLPSPRPVSPMPHWYEVRGGSWQVPPTTLRQIASRLDVWLAGNRYFKAPRDDYAIQFRGELAGERRIVRLLGACESTRIPPMMLVEDFLGIRDGGECNFDAEYDPSKDAISSFAYYGHG